MTDHEMLNLARFAVEIELRQKSLAEFEAMVTGSQDEQRWQQLVNHCDELIRTQHHLRELLEKFIWRGVPEALDLAGPLARLRRQQSELQRQAAEEKSELKKLFQKIFMAVVGGLVLLAPMLIMVLHPGLLTALTTTSVFVLVVAIGLALIMKGADEKDIVAATAAYAAVLVVFVGTSATDVTSSGRNGSESSQNATSGATSDARSMGNVKIGMIVLGCVLGTLAAFALIAFVLVMLAKGYPERILLPIPGGRGLRTQWRDEKKANNAGGRSVIKSALSKKRTNEV